MMNLCLPPDVTSAVGGITSIANSNNFNSIQTQVINQSECGICISFLYSSTAVDPINNIRKLSLLITLIVLISVVGLQVIMALLDAFAPTEWKPSHCGCFKFLNFFLVLLTLILYVA